MKNKIFKGVFLLFISLLTITSCNERELVTIENQSAPILMDVSAEALFLDKNFPDNPALNITWETAKYSVPTPISYKIETSGTSDFKKVYVLGTVNSSQRAASYTVNQMNNAAVDAGLKANVAGKLYIRVTSYLSVSSPSLLAKSNVSNINVTPFPVPKVLFLMGDATVAGNNNNNGNQVIFRDPSNVSLFYFTGYFKAGTFKIIENLGANFPQWGLNGSQVTSYDGTGTEIAGFSIPSSGYYTFTVDINLGTYSLVPYVGSPKTYNSIGLIGSATSNGWDGDTVMKQSTFDSHLWSIVGKVDASNNVVGGVKLSADEVKFRANGNWDVNWGGATAISGQGVQGGPNIPVKTPGTYSVYFNDIDGRYFLIKL